jgi:hypothetical protein
MISIGLLVLSFVYGVKERGHKIGLEGLWFVVLYADNEIAI